VKVAATKLVKALQGVDRHSGKQPVRAVRDLTVRAAPPAARGTRRVRLVRGEGRGVST